MKVHTPIYDPHLSYEENLKNGPFGAFADGSSFFQNQGEPEYDFFGYKVFKPFGVPAGPLLDSKFVIASLKSGFNLPVYKTVRTGYQSCHPKPNVVPVEVEGDLTLEKASLGLISKDEYTSPIAITNSFGVPSGEPDFWQEDMKKAVEAEGKGQVVIGSFQGTNRGEGYEKFAEDYVLASRLVKETGVKVVEANFSCPNEGTSNLLCFDTDRVLDICDRIKNEIGNTPLIIKLAYFEDQNHLENYIKKVGKVVDGFSVINTISAEVRKPNGEQALPGEGRLRSGVCGEPIKWAGLDMVDRINIIQSQEKMNFKIIGVGGVTDAQSYQEYLDKGADAVMSATGMMWNPFLAKEISD